MQPETEDEKAKRQLRARVAGFCDGLARTFKLSLQEVEDAGFESDIWGDMHGFPTGDVTIMFSNILRMINSSNGFSLTQSEDTILIEGARRVFSSDAGDRLLAETFRLSKASLSRKRINKAYALWRKMNPKRHIVIFKSLVENREVAAIFEILDQKGIICRVSHPLLADQIIGISGSPIPYSTLTSEASRYRNGEFSTPLTEEFEQLVSRFQAPNESFDTSETGRKPGSRKKTLLPESRIKK